MIRGLTKTIRFLGIYGWWRTFYKVAGRSRRLPGFVRPRLARVRDVGVIGCGQFAFATIGCILCRRFGNRFVDCCDPSHEAQSTFARFFRIAAPGGVAQKVIANPSCELIYVASNHASHSRYAVACLEAGKRVYIEKPICTTVEQAAQLFPLARAARGRVFAGYNRPHSAAIREIARRCEGTDGPLSLMCIVLGHLLPAGHWYRDPQEGTRICGNVGHWLDLAIHMLAWQGIPTSIEVTLSFADPEGRDENMSIALATQRGDLVTIVMSARGEPFEGINESIVFQQGDVIAKIDDFRTMTLWQDHKRWRRRYRPKDVGHAAAICQPFSGRSRDWFEIEVSTLLMLFVTDMVRAGAGREVFDVAQAFDDIGLDAVGE